MLQPLEYLQIWNGCCKVECAGQAMQVLLNRGPQSRHVHGFQHISQHSLDGAFQHCLSLQHVQHEKSQSGRSCVWERLQAAGKVLAGTHGTGICFSSTYPCPFTVRRAAAWELYMCSPAGCCVLAALCCLRARLPEGALSCASSPGLLEG